MSGANVKIFIERILRLKEEQDGLTADAREIYAEAKAFGFDKTAIGQAVSIIRKRDKDPRAHQERNANVELYLAVYDGGDGTEDQDDIATTAGILSGTDDAARMHAHASEAEPPHDPDTGEIIESAAPGDGAMENRETVAASQPVEATATAARPAVAETAVADPVPMPDFLRRQRAA